MWIALGINAAMLVAEAVGGVLTGSLAVLADAGHVLSDVGAIGLALFAAALAARPAGGRMTFGYQRSEILAALVNGLLLVAVALAIAYAAIGRLGDPPEIEAAGCSGSGLLGLAGNVAATLVLARGERADVNLEGVLRHSAADALGSIGVIVAGVLVLAGGSSVVDPIVSLAISLLILVSSWRLIKEPVDVLMEAAPAGFDVDAAVRRSARGGGALGSRPAHLDRDLRFRRACRARGGRAGLRSRPGAAPDRAAAARALRDRPHHAADGGGGAGDLLHVENAPPQGLIASPVAGVIPCKSATSRLG